MKAPNSVSSIAAIAVALLGIVPLMLILLDRGPEPDEQATPDSTTTTTTVPATPETTIIEISPPDIEGIDPRMSRVLYAYGAASGVQPGATDEIPEEIVKVLAYYDVTLAVPTESAP